MSQPDSVRYSFVIPVYNEEAVLPALLGRLTALMDELDGSCEVILVDDGSQDSSPLYLRYRAQEDNRLRVLRLSRNFGHQIAVTAGIDAARGDAIIIMDADLQDPPEVVHQLIAKWREGHEIVHARRIRRDKDSAFKRMSAHVFYRFLNRLSNVEIPADVGDFRLIGRRAADAFRAMPERSRYVRGMFAWIGFEQGFVDYERHERAAGTTHYPLFKMLRLAVTGLVSFSDMPLRLAVYAGLCVSMAAMGYGLFSIGLKILGGHVIEGWTSTIVIISFLCGVNMIMTGITGLYVGRVLAEVKGRPLYLLADDSKTSVQAPSAQTRASERIEAA